MLIVLLLITLLFVYSLLFEYWTHISKLRGLQYRIHVNGIRGKSSVTRLITAALQGGNIATVGKATGSATMLLDQHGSQRAVPRKGPANVYENVKVLRQYVESEVNAIVFECMAVNPKYQKFLEEKVMQSNIGVITNVREDHMEVLGYTLEDIAVSLSSTIPKNGYLITSEDNPKLRELLKEITKKKGSVFVNALEYDVDDRYMRDFPYYEHKENIQITLAVADIVGIPREVVLDSLKHTIPDPGVTVVEKFTIDGNELTWINLFAVNDRESVVRGVEKILSQYKEQDAATVCILNQREDRPDRAYQFLDIVTRDVGFDLVVTAGAYERQAVHHLHKKHKKYLALNSFTHTTGEELIKKIFASAGKKKILLFGLENIHTVQAEAIMHYFVELRAKKI